MVDTFFVGKYVGVNAIGALSIAFPIQRLMLSLSLLIGVGTATEVARSYGAKNFERLNKSIVNAIFLGLVTLILLPIIVFVFKEFIISKLGASSTIYPLAEEYITIVLIGSLFLGFTNIFGYILNSLGNPKIVLIATSIGAIINIVIDHILVGILDIGIAGAAIATVVSQIIGFIYAFYQMYKVAKKINLKFNLSFDLNIVKIIVAVGFSTFIVEISDAIVIGILNNLLLSVGGDKAIVMIGVITRVSMFMYITMLGISSGMQPLAAYNYGAEEYKKLEKVIEKTTKLAFITSVGIWIVMMLFTPQIIGSFLREKEILKETVKSFRTTISIFPIITFYYVSIYYYQAIKKAKTSLFLSVYRQLLLFIPIVILLGKTLGLFGAWITYPITDLLSSITGLIYIKKGMAFLNDEKRTSRDDLVSQS